MPKTAALVLALLAYGSGCAGDPWQADDASLYTTLREPSPETYTTHLALLLRLVEQREAQGKAPPPGICAECAFYLHRVGRTSEASTYLAKETQHYPEASSVVSALERLIAGRSAIQTNDGQPEEKEP